MHNFTLLSIFVILDRTISHPGQHKLHHGLRIARLEKGLTCRIWEIQTINKYICKKTYQFKTLC